jgi:hypothetical protein
VGVSAAPHAASPATAIPPALERANANIVEIVAFMIASRIEGNAHCIPASRAVPPATPLRSGKNT